jgi:N6-L-threonylcarbamoyladenine synthase
VRLPYEFRAGLAREFEDAVAETLDTKLRRALEEKDGNGQNPQSIIIGGGVSANHVLRAKFQETAKEYAVSIFLPSRHISGDNALMIALAAAVNQQKSGAKNEPLKAHGTKKL